MNVAVRRMQALMRTVTAFWTDDPRMYWYPIGRGRAYAGIILLLIAVTICTVLRKAGSPWRAVRRLASAAFNRRTRSLAPSEIHDS